MEEKAMRSHVARRAEEGFSLLEVLVAAFLLLLVFYGISQYYVRGRTQLDYEENRRKATAIAQDRLDGIRRDFTYAGLSALNGTRTGFVVENKKYTVRHRVVVGSPEPQASTITLTVEWPEKVARRNVTRSLTTTTILARGMP